MKVDPRSVACRRCGAEVNKRCQQSAGPNTYYRPGALERSHSERVTDAKVLANTDGQRNPRARRKP